MSALGDVLAYARVACREGEVEPPMLLRIELALEELFTNTVRHGYGADCESPVWVQADLCPTGVLVIYEDAAPPYDPTAHSARLDAALEARNLGGVGVELVRSVADEMAYRRIDGRNMLTLTFRRTRRDRTPR